MCKMFKIMVNGKAINECEYFHEAVELVKESNSYGVNATIAF